MRRGGGKTLFFISYVIVGIYLINLGFSELPGIGKNFIPVPEALSQIINSWVITLGGILTILGGINYIKSSRRYN